MDRHTANLILEMRLLVGFLGERTQHGWWPTTFFEPNWRTFLDPVFSRTTSIAQYHGVLEAACRVHDEHLSLGCFHLFRLSDEQEQDLHGVLCGGVDFLGECGVGRDKDSSLVALEKLAGSAGAVVTGPILVGKIAELGDPSVLKAIARAYYSGFRNENLVYPYLVKNA